MAETREPIRNFQPIFRPDRRIYHVEGHRVPVPGGVPLAWLGYFAVAVLLVVMLSAGTLAFAGLLALIAGLVAYRLGGPPSAIAAGAVVFVAVPLVGHVLQMLAFVWRLVIVPAAIATFASQPAPDGRKPHRYALTWLSYRLRRRRRSIGRPVSIDGERVLRDTRLHVAPDHHGPELRRARVRGTGTVAFRDPVAVARRGRRVIAWPAPPGARVPRRAVLVDSIELTGRETLEIRA